MKMLTRSDIELLTPEERILLVEEIWDSLCSIPETVSVTDEEKQELDRRFQKHQNDPGSAIPLAELKTLLAKRL